MCLFLFAHGLTMLFVLKFEFLNFCLKAVVDEDRSGNIQLKERLLFRPRLRDRLLGKGDVVMWRNIDNKALEGSAVLASRKKSLLTPQKSAPERKKLQLPSAPGFKVPTIPKLNLKTAPAQSKPSSPATAAPTTAAVAAK